MGNITLDLTVLAARCAQINEALACGYSLHSNGCGEMVSLFDEDVRLVTTFPAVLVNDLEMGVQVVRAMIRTHDLGLQRGTIRGKTIAKAELREWLGGKL